jgi:hypothetical protein
VRTCSASTVGGGQAASRSCHRTRGGGAVRSLGTKRNGARKAFVPSVNDAVDAFYAQVVQVLKPTPPRMPADLAAEAIDAVQRAAVDA